MKEKPAEEDINSFFGGFFVSKKFMQLYFCGVLTFIRIREVILRQREFPPCAQMPLLRSLLRH